MKLYLGIAVCLVLCEIASAAGIVQKFVSPDKSCQLVYEGAESNGDGIFYDITAAKKTVVHKGYLRIAPEVHWLSNSLAELRISEGSPSYHSYYYDCRGKQTSPSYSLSIAFDPLHMIIATLEQEEIAFYRLFSDKEYYRAKAPGVGLMEYFSSCDSQSNFVSGNRFHIVMKCEDGSSIDLKIKLPD